MLVKLLKQQAVQFSASNCSFFLWDKTVKKPSPDRVKVQNIFVISCLVTFLTALLTTLHLMNHICFGYKQKNYAVSTEQ